MAVLVFIASLSLRYEGSQVLKPMWRAVVLLKGVVVPQGPAVEPLLVSGSTASSTLTLIHAEVGADVTFYIRPYAVVS